jgi:hypothetical protein
MSRVPGINSDLVAIADNHRQSMDRMSMIRGGGSQAGGRKSRQPLQMQSPGLKPQVYLLSVSAGLKARSPGLKSGATPGPEVFPQPVQAVSLAQHTGEGSRC